MTNRKLNDKAAEWICALGLTGKRNEAYLHYRELFHSIVKTEATKQRRAASAGLFLMQTDQPAIWTKMITDEIVVYHAGIPLQQLLIYPDGTFEERIVGADILSGEIPQSIIPFGTWKFQRLLNPPNPESFGLFGSILIPA